MVELLPQDEIDMIYGMPTIAYYLGIPLSQAWQLADNGQIPTFKTPGNRNTCARQSSLRAWLVDQRRQRH